VQLLEQLQAAERLVVLQALQRAAIGTVTAVVQDATIIYAVAIVIIAVHAFAAQQQHVAVIVLCGLVFQLVLTQVTKVTIAVMQDMLEADLQALGFTVLAVQDKVQLILLYYMAV
jgi:hypothetical protein